MPRKALTRSSWNWLIPWGLPFIPLVLEVFTTPSLVTSPQTAGSFPGILHNVICAIPIWITGKFLIRRQGFVAVLPSTPRTKLRICLVLYGYVKDGETKACSWGQPTPEWRTNSQTSNQRTGAGMAKRMRPGENEVISHAISKSYKATLKANSQLQSLPILGVLSTHLPSNLGSGEIPKPPTPGPGWL